MQGLWASYLTLTDPGPVLPLPQEEDRIPPIAKGRFVRWGRRLFVLAIGVASFFGADAIATANPIAALASMAVAGLVVVLMTRRRRPPPEERAGLEAALAEAGRAWQPIAEEWQRTARELDLAAERQVISGPKAKLDGLGVDRPARLKELAKPVSESQQRYLEQFRLEEARRFNNRRRAVPRSWGVETAAEIEERKITSIAGARAT
jgi:hypothetical protein